MKRDGITIALLIVVGSSYGQTYISGGIYSNATWSPSGNPYIVTGNTVIFDGVDLTIDPGVIIKFDAGTGLELRGGLIAIGNATDSITFTSNATSPVQGSWTGITVIGTTAPIGIGNQLTMEYCKGEYAYYFVDLDLAYHGPYIFRHCLFVNNHQVNHDGGMPATIFEHCLFQANDQALGWCQFGSRVSHSSFIDNVNGVTGVEQVDTCLFNGNTGIALVPSGATVGCTIQNNNTGVSGPFNSSNNLFTNNTVTDNSTGVEILSYFNGSITFIGNAICNNTAYNIRLLQVNNADLSNNCWCSSDSAFIRSTIYDGYVDPSSGLVDFMPFITDCTGSTAGMNDPSVNNDLSAAVFPNPFHDVIHVRSGSIEYTELTILDMAGRILYRTKFIGSTKLDTDALTQGIYFYRLQTAQDVYTMGKIVKE